MLFVCLSVCLSVRNVSPPNCSADLAEILLGMEVYPRYCISHVGVDCPRGPARVAENVMCLSTVLLFGSHYFIFGAVALMSWGDTVSVLHLCKIVSFGPTQQYQLHEFAVCCT